MRLQGFDEDNERKAKRTNDSTSTSSSRWSDLSKDLLFEICQRVDPRWQSELLRRIRSICTSWRLAVSSPPRQRQQQRQLKFPLTVPNSPQRTNKSKPNLYVKESTYYLMSALPHLCAESSSSDSNKQGWIVRVNEAEPRTWRLLNPIQDSEGLFECTPPIRADINLLDYRMQELARSYTIVYGRHGCKRKEVMLASNKDTTIVGVNFGRRLSFWKTGDTEWRIWSETKDIVKITSHKGKFYAVESNIEVVYEIDPKDITRVTVAAPPQFPKYNRRTLPYNLYFVECQGCLYYIVHRYRKSKCSMSIFVLNEEHCRWDSVTSIKDQVFFLLQDASFAVPARDLSSGSRGGWICFENPFCYQRRRTILSSTSGFEGLEKLDTLAYLSYDYMLCMYDFHEPDEGDPLNQRPHKMTHFKFGPEKSSASLFFPPPPWIKWCCPTRDNGIVSMACLPDEYSTRFDPLTRKRKRE